jgi:hypothetical protein
MVPVGGAVTTVFVEEIGQDGVASAGVSWPPASSKATVRATSMMRSASMAGLADGSAQYLV